jgi:diguanylate cyclase (GGDEF)-like protein
VEDRVASRSVLILGEEESEITRSAISAPLLSDGNVLGAISAQSYQANAYTAVDLEMLEGIAGIAAVALQNARHIAELQHRRREAERIEEIGRALAAALDPERVLGKVVDACAALLSADGAAVWLLDGEPGRARLAASAGALVPPPGTERKLQGLIGERLLRERTPLVIERADGSTFGPDPLGPGVQVGSAMGAPLIVAGEVGGVLWVGSRRGGRFGGDDPHLLQRLASQTSLALENARLHASLRALSLTDPLTGLANRRHLQIYLEREVAAGQRGRSVAAVMFDLDSFKHHNDTQGHITGDAILRAFARILQDEARAMSLVARYGGDEFVSVLSDADIEGAGHYVLRVRSAMAADPLLARHGLSVSSGMAVFEPARMASGDDFLSAADADLYRNKARRPHADTPPQVAEEPS